MHPRNPYRNPPDFAVLADVYPALQPHLVKTTSGKVTINFSDERAQRRLTEAILHRDFHLSLSIPENRLCPPVPNRLNYILWIQDILNATSSAPDDPVYGIDIGAGASAIYPLLGCRTASNWRFIGTDVDQVSLQSAQFNIQQNNLADRISVMQASPDGPIFFPLFADHSLRCDFTMCNPPFYSSAEDIARSAEAKEFLPNAVCTGAEVEMITAGGESEFVSKMVRESMELTTRCRWYTSMVGKLSSLSEIVSLLRSHMIDNYGLTEFVQGQTRRWAIVWSFDDIRLPDHLSRFNNPTLRNLMPPRSTLRQLLPHVPPPTELPTILSGIAGLTLSSTQPGIPLIVTASANTWSRSARRKPASSAAPVSAAAPLLVCRVSIVQDDEGTVLVLVWLRGRDRPAVEGFFSHISKKLRDAAQKHAGK